MRFLCCVLLPCSLNCCFSLHAHELFGTFNRREAHQDTEGVDFLRDGINSLVSRRRD